MLFKRKQCKTENDFQKVWRSLNPHNETVLAKDTRKDAIVVGVGSYGTLDVENAGDGSVKLYIGNYCSIGPCVHFILASEHPYKNLSTFPWIVKNELAPTEAQSKGDIVLDDDVWIGLGAIINSGVHIGRGAIVASGAVVVKDVEPYSIVGGNPAKHIKYRFDKNIRDKLMKFDFNSLNHEKIVKNIDLLYTEVTKENVDEILKTLKD